MAWTEQQQEAIDSRNKNLLVAAAAGSGKTAVLVNRIAEIISSGECNIDEMLIVTFTDAAAKEMRTRIHTEILKRMREETDAEKLAKLERQSILLSGASIMTFHSFCLNVLKRHFSKIELDPKFRTAEENELKILMQEVVEELFEENYANATQEFLKFTDEFGGNDRGDSILHSLVIGLYNFSQSRPYPEKWLHSLVDDYEFKTSEKFNGLTWFDYTMKIAKSQVEENLQNVSEECQNAIKTANNSKIYTGGDSKISANWDKLIQILEDDFFVIDNLNKSKNNWDELYEKLHKDKKMFGNFLSGGYKLNDELKDVKAEILAARNAYKKILENLRDKTVDFTEKEIKSEMFELAESVNEFVRVTIEFGKKFSAAKRERGIIDFNDMEHLALKILSDESTAKIYREKFKIIMVDEYQDTNGVQEEIIGKFVRDNNFFAVGDVKQSIYRFRQADPEIFMKKYDEYPKLYNSKRIDLSKNFRSRDEVINSVNAIFEQLMNKKDMEIEYDDDAKLYRGAIYPEHENIFNEPTEFFILTEEMKNKNFSTADDDDENEAEELAGIEREIQLIANKIKNLMHAKKFVWDKDTNEYRPLKYRDIVILLRSVDGKASKIVDVLKKNEIPAYAADKEGYFKAEEIQIILSLLTVLDNARQDIPLASVMLSPIGGFTAEDLANLRIKNRYADLYTLVNENPEICGEFLNKINRWRELARQVSVPELLSTIYRETGYYDFVGKSFRGKIAQANLRMLVDRAAQYETTAFRGLSRFIKFMKKIRDLNNDLSSARTLGENEDVVRVMTIHKSKGLEFPVVFVAELGKKFNTTDTKKNILLHRKLGIGIYRAIESDYGLMKLPTFARRIIAEKIKYENLAEELRVLYVAFTRAREKLFLVGTFKGNSDSIFKLFADFNKQPKDDEKLSTQKIKSAVNPLNWLIPAAQFAQNFIKTEILSEDEIATSTIEILPEELAEEKFALPEKVEESPLKNIPAKISVTELKRRAESEEDFGEQFETLQNKKSGKKILYRRPDFERTNKISGSEYGTIVHSVMQMLDLNSDLSLEGITTQISEMVDKKLILPEHAKIIRVKNIAEFFKSPIGERLLNSDEIYRELPFSRLISAKDFFKQVGEEKIFIQGIIDLLFQDSVTKNWILLDYKTDSPAEDEIFKERYKIQIQLYAQAIENLLGLKIAEKYLYMISSGKTIEM